VSRVPCPNLVENLSKTWHLRPPRMTNSPCSRRVYFSSGDRRDYESNWKYSFSNREDFWVFQNCKLRPHGLIVNNHLHDGISLFLRTTVPCRHVLSRFSRMIPQSSQYSTSIKTRARHGMHSFRLLLPWGDKEKAQFLANSSWSIYDSKILAKTLKNMQIAWRVQKWCYFRDICSHCKVTAVETCSKKKFC
jgi:hypothetical protein